jgi:hypothetical protein
MRVNDGATHADLRLTTAAQRKPPIGIQYPSGQMYGDHWKYGRGDEQMGKLSGMN